MRGANTASWSVRRTPSCRSARAASTSPGGIFSNITHDHLDYHKTFAEYIRAKKRFFDGLPKGAFALTNADDRNGTGW